MNFDKENLADDERNDTLTRLLQRRDELGLKNLYLIRDLEKIKQVWTGAANVKVNTTTEAYLECLCKEMFAVACETIIRHKS